jgi:hypothetical protein
MNANDRKTLRSILDTLHGLRSRMADATPDLDALATAERDKVENLPDGLRESDRGQEMEEKCDTLESAYSDIESALDSIEDALNSLDDLL